MRDRLIDILMSKPYGQSSYEEFADYLLAEGVIVPPCKVGDTLYEVTVSGKITTFTVRSFYQIARWMEYGIFGCFLFTTREEAEKALAERSEGEGK